MTLIATALSVASGTLAEPAKKPLKIFILAGQSNMEGHAKASTFDAMALDPLTAPLLKEMQSPKAADKVWITYLYGDGGGNPGGSKHGKLTIGYGAQNEPTKIGPELTFGITMQKLTNEPILIIKTAWGGKSLHTDFRPPSAGAYVMNQFQLDKYAKQGKDVEAMKAEKAAASGRYYHLMTDYVRKVLSDIKSVYPNYDAKQGYELAGFAWLQGWNDLVDGDVYPDRQKPGGYDSYATLLAQFIRDVRKDLSAPKLPFAIGVMGISGVQAKPNSMTYFREAMAAPGNLPEFKGNVVNVLTEKFWDSRLEELVTRSFKVDRKRDELQKDASLTPEQCTAAVENYRAELFTPEELTLLTGASNREYHYLGAAKILGPIGKALAEALVELRKKKI
jgi:alpha-galactosidase